MTRIVLFISSFIFLLYSCKSIQPEIPESKIENVPPIEQPLSSIVVPVKMNLAPYFKEADNSIPKKFSGKQEQCEDVSFSYNFVREPIHFSGSKKSLSFDVAGKYALKLNYCPQCTDLFDSKGNCVVPRVYVSCGVDEPMRKIEIGYKTLLSISPEFKLKSTTSLHNVEIIDPCEISVFKYDASATLKKEITKALKGLEKDIDKEIGKIDIKTEAEKAWKSLASPIAMGKYGFLYTNPQKIGLDNLSFEGSYATMELSLGLKPAFKTEKNTSEKIPELPKLSQTNTESGFRIVLDLKSGYDSLSTILSREIKGKETEIKGRKVIFESIKVISASNKQLNFEIKFSGKKKGTLFVVGTPVFDKEKQIISCPDLTFDIKTKSALLKSAKWLFNDKITEVLRANTLIDLNPHFDQLKLSLNKEINTTLDHNIKLSGKIDTIKMENIFPTEKELIIRVISSGNLSVEL